MSSGVAYLGKTNAAILNGELDLSSWSEEELRRGQRRASNGRFHGRPPKVVPKAIHDELVKRLQAKARAKFDEDLYDAVAILGTIVRDSEASNADRITAAKLIIERALGKATERVEIKSDQPWLVALQAGVVAVNSIQVERTPELESGSSRLELDAWEEADPNVYDD